MSITDFKELRSYAGGVLLDYQKKWVEDKAPIKIIEKSRRVGISWAEAADDTLYAASESGDDVWYIGYTKDMAEEFILDCAGWAKHYNNVAVEVNELALEDEDKDILSFRINFASGYRITALSSRPKNLRGKQGRVIIDEAAFHDDLDGLLKAATALKMWGGEIRIISTHLGEDNPFNELILECRAGKLKWPIHRVTLDEALAQGLYRRICEVLGREWTPEGEKAWRDELYNDYRDSADEELGVNPSGSTGTYLPRALVFANMDESIPVLRWKCKDDFVHKPKEIREAAALDWCKEHFDPILEALPKNRRTFFGEDFARSGDLSFILPVIEGQTLHYRSICAVELRNVPFEQQRQVLFYLCDRLPRFCGGAMDARGNGQYLAEVAMQKYGASRILQVMPTQDWYIEAMPKYKQALEDRTITLPRDSDILADHRLVKMERGVAKVPDTAHTKGADGGKRHGDGAIGGSMAIYATEHCAGGETEYESVEKRTFASKGAY